MRDMTQSALAERLRFSAATINRYVRGTSKPRYADRAVIWAATDIPVRSWDQEPEP
jgi:transcriptional regulator with XRE-family HTH domain